MSGLAGKRLVVVTGKGGVGKTTVSAALGLAAARAGRRTMVAEMAGQDRVARAFGKRPTGFKEHEIAPDLFTTTIDYEPALDDFLHMKAGRFADVLKASRVFGNFAAATPGMREVVQIGKVWELAQERRRVKGASPYDLVIFDAPATGHGVGILGSAKTFANVARVGPIADHGNEIDSFVRDTDATAILAVALAEEMPVNETMTLRDSLHERLGLHIDSVVVNGVWPDRFADDEVEAIAGIDGDASPLARAAVRAALSADSRAATQREQIARLAEEVAPPLELPFLFGAAELDDVALEQLSRPLEELL